MSRLAIYAPRSVHIDSVMIAARALAHPDGTVSMIHGGLAKVALRPFPAVLPLSIVIRFRFEGFEVPFDSELQVAGFDPAGKEIARLGGHMSISRAPDADPTEVLWATTVLDMHVAIPGPGTLRFDVSVGSETWPPVPLIVV